MFIEVRLECSRTSRGCGYWGGALKTSRLRVERKDGFLLVDEDKGGRLPWECTKDHGDGDLRMASSLRGLVPRAFLLVVARWWGRKAS